ncbi:phage tail fiber protein [Klebsiella pneumoniae]
MTVSTQVSRNEYTGNGATTQYDFTFRILDKSHLLVQTLDNSESIVTLTLGTDYTVTGVNRYNGGKVVLTSALPAGYKISIERSTPVTQEASIRNQGGFFPEIHEDALDKLTMLVQQAYGWWSGLSLRKPSWLANYYDALNNRIRNLRDPSQAQDAATKGYADNLYQGAISHSDNNFKRALRVPENSVPPLPSVEFRKNKIVAMDNNGNPIMVLPESGSAADVMIEYAKPTGGGGIGLLHGGNVQHLQNFLSFDMFGVDNTGLTDVHDALKIVAAKANELGMKVVQRGGTYRLGKGDGSGSIVFNYGLEMPECKLIIDSTFTTYDGFTFTNPVAPTVYDSSSNLVAAINASNKLVAQSSVIDGLSGITDVNGCTLFMTSSDTKLYKARGTDVYWKHACRLSHYGRMDNVFKYSVNTVDSVIALPARNAVTNVILPDIDFSENVGALQIFNFKYVTGYRVKAGRVIARNANNTHQTALVSFNYFDDVDIDSFSDIHPQYGFNGNTSGQTIYTNYTFNWNFGKNFRMRRCKAQGYGWGVTGGSFTWGQFFLDCDLNRYDMHDAVFDYQLLENCRIGNYGVAATTCCDTWIKTSQFVFGDDTAPELANLNAHRALISGRPDYGGFADGNLYIENCVVDGYMLDPSGVDSGIALFKTGVNSDSSIGTDTSYAVTPRFWRDIVVDGLRFNRYGLNVNSVIWNSSPERVMYAPRSIKLKNCDFNNSDIISIQLERFTPEVGSNNTSSPLAVQHHPYIELDNVENVVGVAMPAAANTSYWNPLVTVKGLKNTRSGDKPYFSTAQRGKYTFDGACDLKWFSSSYGGKYSSLGVVVKFNGSTIGDGVATPLVVGAAGSFVDSWSADGATFIGDYSATSATAANVLLARYMKMSACSVMDASFSFISTLRVLTPSVPKNTETSVELYVQSGAKLELLHNASSVAVNVPIVAANTGNHVVPVYTTPVTPTEYYTRMVMGARGNQVYLSSLYTTADNIAAVNLIH